MNNKASSNSFNDNVIRIGIDLGTTNSEVAVNINGDIEIVKNAGRREFTPSVFGINKSLNKVVGEKAYDRLYKFASEEEFQNNKAEVKRLMGTAETVHFQRTGEELNAEEISAEIIKSLRGDVTREYVDFSAVAAVITIPAYFSTLQAEATKRAGYLAGFQHVVLLQEPIAAAMAYGFDNAFNENWLVYDLGGGTFDVALISSKDGVLSVLGHSGNNFLGGKDFDNLIIDEIIVPRLNQKFKLTNFNRSNPELKSEFALLKGLAETAKIELSQDKVTTIEVEGIGEDSAGTNIYMAIKVSSNEFETLIEPKIRETIVLTQKTISDSGVDHSSISRIVLVGGPTQIPYLQSRLEDTFNLKIDTSVDPLTVVAKGACVYGLSQQIPQELMNKSHPKMETELAVTLNYDSLTADDEQTITGVIPELAGFEEGYYIQVQADSGTYTSAKLKVKKGKFFDTISLEKNRVNNFWIYLFDEQGNSLPLHPDSFSITNGLTVSGAPIPHSIGVVYAKKMSDSEFELREICDLYFEKGSVLPLSRTETYKTNKPIVKGKNNDLLIKVYEGESPIPDRNDTITRLKIEGSTIPYDLPSGTSIDITINIDESRQVSVKGHVPTIELTVNARADLTTQEIDTAGLKNDLRLQSERLQKIKNTLSPEEYLDIESEMKSLYEGISNASNDEDEKRKSERDLKNLKMQLDQIEAGRKLPALIEEFKDLEVSTQEYIENIEDQSAEARFQDMYRTLKNEGNLAVKNEDKPMLVRVNQQLYELRANTILDNPGMLIGLFHQLQSRKDDIIDQEQATYYFERGESSIIEGDVETLKHCVRSLFNLLPSNIAEQVTSGLSGISK